MGNAHPNIVPYQVFATSDGHAIVAVGNDRQFRDLCTVVELPELASDARFGTNADRVENRETLIALLGAGIRKLTRHQLLNELEKRAVPCGPINSVADIFQDPQIAARGLKVNLPAADLPAGEIPTVRTPIIFSDAELTLSRPSPRLGEHTEEVARELGY